MIMETNQNNKYTFSGHETFYCKNLWLKKGYDFVKKGNSFTSEDSVVTLGVGKNMVSSIRYWLRSFGLLYGDSLTEIANYIFDDEKGKDPYIEDLGTLWLLHFLLVEKKIATLYNWFFIRFQRERLEFDKQQVVRFVERCMVEDNKKNLFNSNTVKKDVGVLLQSYILPSKSMTCDDYYSLLIDLELIRSDEDKTFRFNLEGKRELPWYIFLYAILEKKGENKTVSFDLLQEIGLIFCMSDIEVIEKCLYIQGQKPNIVRYSDTAGVKQLQFLKDLSSEVILDEYYG